MQQNAMGLLSKSGELIKLCESLGISKATQRFVFAMGCGSSLTLGGVWIVLSYDSKSDAAKVPQVSVQQNVEQKLEQSGNRIGQQPEPMCGFGCDCRHPNRVLRDIFFRCEECGARFPSGSAVEF